MRLKIFTIIFLIMENLSKVFAQATPMTPCPNIFQYRFDGSQWSGILAVRNAEVGQPLNVRVTLSIRGKPATNFFGEIQLLTRGQFFSKEPVYYKIKFPNSYLPPKLLQIIVNDQVVCMGAADLNIFVTQIQLEHTRKFTFIPHNMSTPVQPTSLPFLPGSDVMGLDGGQSATGMKEISTPLQPTDTAFDGDNIFTYTSKEKSPMQNLKGYCGTIDVRVRFNVFEALKQIRPSSRSEDNRDNVVLLRSPKSNGDPQAVESEKTFKIHRPLIISNISDDYFDAKRNQPPIIRGAWPWLAAVYVNNLTTLVHQCSGTLVSSQVVISAAHCFQLFNQHYTSNEVLVFLGRHNLGNWSEEDSLAASVEDIFIHPSFNKNLNSYDGDIAVLVLKTKVRFNFFIRPACLWSGSVHPKYIQGEHGIVVAWSPGSRFTNSFDMVPKILSAPIVSHRVCFQVDPRYRSLSSNRTLCAGATTGGTIKLEQLKYYGPCTGDSGAGLMISKGNRWVLRGLVSGLLPDTKPTPNPSCSINQFVIYTDVAQFLDWIIAFMV